MNVREYVSCGLEQGTLEPGNVNLSKLCYDFADSLGCSNILDEDIEAM